MHTFKYFHLLSIFFIIPSFCSENNKNHQETTIPLLKLDLANQCQLEETEDSSPDKNNEKMLALKPKPVRIKKGLTPNESPIGPRSLSVDTSPNPLLPEPPSYPSTNTSSETQATMPRSSSFKKPQK